MPSPKRTDFSKGMNGVNGPLLDRSRGKNPQPPGPTTTTTTTTQKPGLSSDDMALYDRQIRLWGAQAQQRIQSAHILLVSLRALGTEIAKNLTLAGVRSLTIVDSEPVTEEDLGSQFFLREEDIGKPRAEAALPRLQELNPRVTVRADGGLPELIMKNQTYYAPFDCIIACDYDIMTLNMINSAARLASRPFYAAGIHGFYGYIFADLIAHSFVVEREKSNKPTNLAVESITRMVTGVSEKENNGKTIEIVKKQEVYCPILLANTSILPPDITGNRRKLKGVPPLLPCLRAIFDFQRDHGHLPGRQQQDIAIFTTLAQQKHRELALPTETLDGEFLKSFIRNIGSEITPTAAFVGGRLSEDVINVLGKREQPIQNFALFDGDSLEGKIYSLYTDPDVLLAAPGTLPLLLQEGMLPNLGDMPMDMSMDIAVDMSMGGDSYQLQPESNGQIQPQGNGENTQGNGEDLTVQGLASNAPQEANPGASEKME